MMDVAEFRSNLDTSTAGLVKGPARSVAGSPGSCAGPVCVFSTDLEPPGQGAPARLMPPLRDARESAVPTGLLSTDIIYWPSQRHDGGVVMVALDGWKEKAIRVLDPLGLESEG
jgi:hypothetical protein